jgi:hypothetical protein
MRAHSRDFRPDVRVPLFRLHFWRFYYVRTNVFRNLSFFNIYESFRGPHWASQRAVLGPRAVVCPFLTWGMNNRPAGGRSSETYRPSVSAPEQPLEHNARVICRYSPGRNVGCRPVNLQREPDVASQVSLQTHEISKSCPATAMQTTREKECSTVLILDLGTRRGEWSAPRHNDAIPRERTSGTHWKKAGWAPEPVWTQTLEEKSFAVNEHILFAHQLQLTPHHW